MLALVVAIVGGRPSQLPDTAHAGELVRHVLSWLSCPEEIVTFLVRSTERAGLQLLRLGADTHRRGVDAKLFIDGRMHVWERDGYLPMADYDLIFTATTGTLQPVPLRLGPVPPSRFWRSVCSNSGGVEGSLYGPRRRLPGARAVAPRELLCLVAMCRGGSNRSPENDRENPALRPRSTAYRTG